MHMLTHYIAKKEVAVWSLKIMLSLNRFSFSDLCLIKEKAYYFL